MLSSQVTFPGGGTGGKFPNVSTNFPFHPARATRPFHPGSSRELGSRKIFERNRVDNYEPTFAFGVR